MVRKVWLQQIDEHEKWTLVAALTQPPGDIRDRSAATLIDRGQDLGSPPRFHEALLESSQHARQPIAQPRIAEERDGLIAGFAKEFREGRGRRQEREVPSGALVGRREET